MIGQNDKTNAFMNNKCYNRVRKYCNNKSSISFYQSLLNDIDLGYLDVEIVYLG